jgi:hypothetical protein
MPWIFYGWFVFAAVFIAAYFVWVWFSSRNSPGPPENPESPEPKTRSPQLRA